VAQAEYARRLGLFSGTMAVVGGIIGAGIFLNPAIVAQRTGSVALTLGGWVLGGAVALLGAFIYGELGQRLPKAGGGYVYLREAFGPLPAFLAGWALLLAVATGAIAAVAYTFASYLAALTGLGPGAAPGLATAAILVLTVVNILGVTAGAYTQNTFTVLKLAALGVLCVVGLVLPGPAVPGTAEIIPGGGEGSLRHLLGVMGVALVPVLFTYGGWQQTNYIAGELRDPERTLPRALVLGVGIVVTVYLLANVAYLRALGLGGLAASTAPAADTMEALLGPRGRTFISLGIVVSTFGFLNLVILASPRVYQAMAADGLFPPAFARLHPRFRTPVAALVAQAAWALVLLHSGTYGDLLDWVVFADWITFGAVAATLLVLRRRPGGMSRGFRDPLYPVSVLLFIAAALYVVWGSVASNPVNALKGIGMLAAGVPVYLYGRLSGSARR
jgi:APA family basic amino acid/polyamine antiporter